MRTSALAVTLGELLLFSHVEAGSLPRFNRRQVPPRPKDSGAPTPGFFDQLIDHNDPGLGTFKQRFWFNADHYGGAGSPVILEAPGEAAVQEENLNFSNSTLTGLIAQTNKAATIALEHRYFGNSTPSGQNLTARNLQHLTLDNAIQDLIHFSRNVNLPFDRDNSSKPDKAPWVLSGCSYPGALAAWTNVLAPGTFWAYHCSSAPVEAISSYWQYFSPIEQAMPRNCSADFKKIISHVDDILFNGTAEAKHDLKTSFGLGNITHDDEFAEQLTDGLGQWQGTQFGSGYTNFTAMCDYIENKWPNSSFPTPGPEGVGLDRAVEGFARYMKEGPKDPPEQSPDDDVSWSWFLCNEPFEWWQVWGPGSDNGLVSRSYTRNSSLRQCDQMFPDGGKFTYGLKQNRTVEQLNAKTGGWNHVNTTRLMWVNGEYDPWRSASVSSEYRPGGPLKSTKEAPVYVIPKGAHCNDILVGNGEVNEGARKVIDGVVQQMTEWVSDYYTQRRQHG